MESAIHIALLLLHEEIRSQHQRVGRVCVCVMQQVICDDSARQSAGLDAFQFASLSDCDPADHARPRETVMFGQAYSPEISRTFLPTKW